MSRDGHGSVLRRGRAVVLLIVLLGVGSLSGTCIDVGQLFEGLTVWQRHVIDGGRDGADGVRLGDLDGDGRLDLVVAWEEAGEVVAYINPGPQRAALPWVGVRVGRVGSVEDAVFVDLDDDGALDVVSCSEGSRTVYVHWSPPEVDRRLDPDAWQTQPLPATQGVCAWMFCTPAQIDGRRGIDLVVGGKGAGAQVGWLESPADPRDTTAWRWHALRPVGWTMSLLAFDLDGDGDLDIVGSDRKGALRGSFWLENPGARVLEDSAWTARQIGSAANNVMFMDLGDIDGDGRIDAIVAEEGRALIVQRRLTQQQSAWGTIRIALDRDVGSGKGVRLADVDQDGRVDAVFTCEDAGGKMGVAWLPVARALAGEIVRARGIGGKRGSKFDLVQVLDLDGDGDLDVLTCEESENLGVIWYENPLGVR